METVFSYEKFLLFSYSEMFIECGGVQCLTDLFEIMVPKGLPDRHICLILNIIKSLLNIKSGKNAILQNEKLMDLMATLAGISVAKSKILVLQILGGLCLVDNGREKVLESFSSSQSSLFENVRFQARIHNFMRYFLNLHFVTKILENYLAIS